MAHFHYVLLPFPNSWLDTYFTCVNHQFTIKKVVLLLRGHHSLSIVYTWRHAHRIRISLMVSAVLRHWIPSRWWPKTYGPTSDSAVVYPTNPSIQSTISFPGPSVCTLGYDSLPGGGADSSGIKEHSSRAAANDRLNSFFQNLSMSLPITPYIRWSKTHLFYDE